MDCLFFLVVQLLPKKGMGLELKGQWGELHMLKWKFWCLEAEKGEESVRSKCALWPQARMGWEEEMLLVFLLSDLKVDSSL